MSNNKFTSYGYNNFITEWHLYYQNNFASFKEELNNLKNNLPAKSSTNIDNFINTILFKIKPPCRNYLIRKNYLYSAEEQQQILKEKLSSKEVADIKNNFCINNDFLIQVPVFRYHNGLKLLPKQVTQTIFNKTIIDCGAYYGDSSLVFTKYKPKKIYSLEPSSVNFNFLQQTINDNNLQQTIVPINKGIGERNELSSISFNSFHKPNLGAKINASSKVKNKEQTAITTIDSLVENNKIKDISAIKLDIEGLELDAIIGAKNTIKKYKPILLIAIYHNAEEFLNTKPFLESLNLGYNFLMHPLDTKDILKEFYLIAY